MSERGLENFTSLKFGGVYGIVVNLKTTTFLFYILAQAYQITQVLATWKVLDNIACNDIVVAKLITSCKFQLNYGNLLFFIFSP